MSHLVDAVERAYRVLGLEDAAGRDEVFRHRVLARIIEPASKQDSLRVLDEAGVGTVSYPTLNRHLPVCAQEEWRQRLSAACTAHAGLGRPASCSTTCPRSTSRLARATGSASPGSPRSAVWPQITLGLLTGQDGFPLMVSAFEGNRPDPQP
jgi:hypothetical protein